MPLGLVQYGDLLAKVRGDSIYHSVRHLVQPDDPDVRDVADRLIQLPEFIYNAHTFVHQFVKYGREIGDFWGTPSETMTPDENGKYWGDCDCLSILLTSILRVYIDPLSVFVAVGTCRNSKRNEGHAWVVVKSPDGTDQIVEPTASPDMTVEGVYNTMILFNDKYAFATARGLKEYDLKPVPLVPELGEPIDMKEVAYAYNQ